MGHVARAIDLNADLGEGFPNDAVLLGLVTSACVCCGAHAGDPTTILATLRVARERGVIVGAHPGYPDREGFGRREMEMSAEQVEALIRSQVGDLLALAKTAGAAVRFLKPHGALYNQAQRDPKLGAGVLAAAKALGLPIVGLPESRLATEAKAADVRFIAEGFPERRYRRDGSLVPRDRAGGGSRRPGRDRRAANPPRGSEGGDALHPRRRAQRRRLGKAGSGPHWRRRASKFAASGEG